MLRTPEQRREEKAKSTRWPRRSSPSSASSSWSTEWNQPAYSLSYANRRRLEIARAMAAEPRLLLLDEPAAGMNPVETHEITELIGRLRTEGGYTILVIEHDMHVVEGVSDRVVALDHGVKIAEGSFESVATNERVVEAYLGLRGVGGDVSANSSTRCSSWTPSHVLRPDSHPPGAVARRPGGGARLPARRQRLRQVDDAEDRARHRPAEERPACAFDGEDITDRPTSYRIEQGHGDRTREPAPLRSR